jgi:hypothetical protein
MDVLDVLYIGCLHMYTVAGSRRLSLVALNISSTSGARVELMDVLDVLYIGCLHMYTVAGSRRLSLVALNISSTSGARVELP